MCGRITAILCCPLLAASASAAHNQIPVTPVYTCCDLSVVPKSQDLYKDWSLSKLSGWIFVLADQWEDLHATSSISIPSLSLVARSTPVSANLPAVMHEVSVSERTCAVLCFVQGLYIQCVNMCVFQCQTSALLRASGSAQGR